MPTALNFKFFKNLNCHANTKKFLQKNGKILKFNENLYYFINFLMSDGKKLKSLIFFFSNFYSLFSLFFKKIDIVQSKKIFDLFKHSQVFLSFFILNNSSFNIFFLLN